MAQLLSPPFGTAKDGYKVVSGIEDINYRSWISGSVGAKTCTVGSVVGFNSGDLIFIHKSQGMGTTTCGSWELNRLSSAPSGQTFYLDIPLQNTYPYSGNDISQVLRVPEYRDLWVPSGQYIRPPVWNRTSGGIVVAFCNGTTKIDGQITAAQYGFSFGQGHQNGRGYYAEGHTGPSGFVVAGTANGSGGGGADERSNGGGGGGGGGNMNYGSAGGATSSYGGDGGAPTGNAELTLMTFGGGGGRAGGGGSSFPAYDGGGWGGYGGGIVVLFSKILIVNGSIVVDGQPGYNAFNSYNSGSGGGGGGAGGSILIKTLQGNIGTNKVTAVGGSGGVPTGSGKYGGAGSAGRIRIEAGSLTGSTNGPSPSRNTSVVSWAGAVGVQG